MIRLAKMQQPEYTERVKFLERADVAAASTSSEDRPPLYGIYNHRVVPTSVWLSGAVVLWKQGFTGAGVTIGVIDSGIAPHSDLDENVIAHYDFVNVDGRGSTKLNEHGTHVAGTIAAHGKPGRLYGVAPDAQIIDYRVLDEDGSGSYEAITKAIRHAADHCDIINMSLGGPDNPPHMHEAIKYAVNIKNKLVVVASGNFKRESRQARSPPRKDLSLVSYPAYYPEVVGVGAVDLNSAGSVQRAFFSYYNGELDLCADGVDLLSCGMNDDYVTMSGTSMASPVVAGLAALLLSKAKQAGTVQISEPTLYAMLKSASLALRNSNTSDVPDEWLYGRGLASVFPLVPTLNVSEWTFPRLGEGGPTVAPSVEGNNHHEEEAEPGLMMVHADRWGLPHVPGVHIRPIGPIRVRFPFPIRIPTPDDLIPRMSVEDIRRRLPRGVREMSLNDCVRELEMVACEVNDITTEEFNRIKDEASQALRDEIRSMGDDAVQQIKVKILSFVPGLAQARIALFIKALIDFGQNLTETYETFAAIRDGLQDTNNRQAFINDRLADLNAQLQSRLGDLFRPFDNDLLQLKEALNTFKDMVNEVKQQINVATQDLVQLQDPAQLNSRVDRFLRDIAQQIWEEKLKRKMTVEFIKFITSMMLL